MKKANLPDPTVQILDGVWCDYTHELDDDGLRSAKRITYSDGREEFVIEADSDMGRWSIHLHKVQDRFVGSWIVDKEARGFQSEMQLYRSVSDPNELLLLGTWDQPDGSKSNGSFRLWPESDDK